MSVKSKPMQQSSNAGVFLFCSSLMLCVTTCEYMYYFSCAGFLLHQFGKPLHSVRSGMSTFVPTNGKSLFKGVSDVSWIIKQLKLIQYD